MNFAPYQDQSPEIERALSPPLPDRTRAKQATVTSPESSSPTQASPTQGLPSPSHFGGEDGRGGSHGNTGFWGDTEGGRLSLGAFETSLPMRMDFEAMLAYLLLPPAGGVFLLLVEHKSDYVRFHAWQSSMLFTAMFIIHMIFAWTSIISWLLFICDLAMMGFLSMRAYKDVDSLEHYEVPFFGRLANSFVDNE